MCDGCGDVGRQIAATLTARAEAELADALRGEWGER